MRRYTPIQPGTEELLLSSRKVHPPVVRFGGKQDSLTWLRVFRGWANDFRGGGVKGEVINV